MCSAWRTRAFMPAKKRTIRPSSRNSRSSATSVSTTPSPPRTARMPRPKASATCCPPMPAAPCRPNSSAGKALEAPAHPVIAIVGGAKVSTKLDLLDNLVSKVDALVIGGGMANTFLHAQGVDVGKSLCEKDLAADRAAHSRQGRDRELRDHPAGRRRGRRALRSAMRRRMPTASTPFRATA